MAKENCVEKVSEQQAKTVQNNLFCFPHKPQSRIYKRDCFIRHRGGFFLEKKERGEEQNFCKTQLIFKKTQFIHKNFAHLQLSFHSQNRKNPQSIVVQPCKLSPKPTTQNTSYTSHRDCSNIRTISVTPLLSPSKHKQKNNTLYL